tara:strand:+ start:909 stop:1214 length:306 start_codon:yes stop_codon:yes gene_type:complete
MEQKTEHKLTVDRQPTTNKELSADSITEDLKRHTLKRQRRCQQVHCSSSSWSKHEPIKQLNEHELKYLGYAIATPIAISVTSKSNDLDTSSANELNNDKSN